MSCSYPLPADRRVLAAQRAAAQAERGYHRQESDIQQVNDPLLSPRESNPTETFTPYSTTDSASPPSSIRASRISNLGINRRSNARSAARYNETSLRAGPGSVPFEARVGTLGMSHKVPDYEPREVAVTVSYPISPILYLA